MALHKECLVEVEVVSDLPTPKSPVPAATTKGGPCRCCRPPLGTDPTRWASVYPRHPHPDDMDFPSHVPESYGRLEPVPVICGCNTSHSMIVLQNTPIEGKKGHDTVQLWCTLCWVAPHVTVTQLKAAYSNMALQLQPIAREGASELLDSASGKKPRNRVN